MKPIARINVNVLLFIIVSFTSLLACDFLSVVGGGPTPFPIETDSMVGTGAIAGFLWHDSCGSPAEDREIPPTPPPGCIFQPSTNGLRANGLPDSDERGIEGVQVTLGEGVCPSSGLTTATTDGDGLYLFTGLRAGTYCVMVDPKQGTNASLLPPGLWTYPAETLPDETIVANVVLEDDEIKSDVFFGWDYELLPPFEPSATEISTEIAATSVPSLTETPTASDTPTFTPTSSFTPTETVSTTDPKSGLGDPTWRDTF